MREFDRKLILEDGQEFYGYGFGGQGERICEIVFNTSMVGYQEILSDPSYTDQAVVMTYPLIGNYGMAHEDYETDIPSMGALIVREYNDAPSNFRSSACLGQVMEQYGIPGICGVDTRRLTRSIRDFGSRKALVAKASTPLDQGLGMLNGYEMRQDQVARVSCKKPYCLAAEGERFHVAVIDCGAKRGILRQLNRLGCRVTVTPWDTPAEEVEAMRPDGILISNGPGNPESAKETVETVRKLLGRYPLFGICLGHQIISLACGARTYRLKFGHRGGNHPVKDLQTGRVYLSSQNHGYVVDTARMDEKTAVPAFVNVNDGTNEGLSYTGKNIFTVQFHPEACPGPRDSGFLFDKFIKMMEVGKNA